jgi:5-deoxy-glucuronate isomerase
MLNPLSPTTCIVRGTHTRRGRSLFVSPETSATRWLRYGRIRLDDGDAPVRVETGDRECALVCLAGRATVALANESWTLGRYDAFYVPRDAVVDVAANEGGCDLAELSAPVEGRYRPAFVSIASVKADPALHFTTGGAGSQRELHILVGKNVEAGRLMAGVTFSEPGHWTSWPPHEHAGMLEEAYLYIDMPAPAFGVQLVYTDPGNPEIATIVREGDCVIMPQGYHPNVAAPGGRIGFLWFMAAHRERVDRQFGVVTVQPEFAAKGSGLEASRK